MLPAYAPWSIRSGNPASHVAIVYPVSHLRQSANAWVSASEYLVEVAHCSRLLVQARSYPRFRVFIVAVPPGTMADHQSAVRRRDPISLEWVNTFV